MYSSLSDAPDIIQRPSLASHGSLQRVDSCIQRLQVVHSHSGRLPEQLSAVEG